MKIDNQQGTTLVIGASINPERYANKAVLALRLHGHQVIAFGPKSGIIGDCDITTSFPDSTSVDTITMYIGPDRQEQYYEKIIRLNPKRIIFNPGTENPKFYLELKKHAIEVIEACTLVMLSIGDY